EMPRLLPTSSSMSRTPSATTARRRAGSRSTSTRDMRAPLVLGHAGAPGRRGLAAELVHPVAQVVARVTGVAALLQRLGHAVVGALPVAVVLRLDDHGPLDAVGDLVLHVQAQPGADVVAEHLRRVVAGGGAQGLEDGL